MGKLDCPYCDNIFRFRFVECEESFRHDSEHEFLCPQCDKKFLATVYWDLCFTGERKFDCLHNEAIEQAGGE